MSRAILYDAIFAIVFATMMVTIARFLWAMMWMARWRVDIICHRSEHLGTVEDADEKAAIEKAANQFDIPPERQNRIAVAKMSKDKD
jgi:hypothetical protein